MRTLIPPSSGEDEAAAMRVLLVRHGDAEDGPDDASRPLSKRGFEEADAIGRLLARTREIPTIVWHSPLLRARQTAEAAVRACGAAPQGGISEHRGLLPCDDPDEIEGDLACLSGDDRLLIATHAPYVARLASCMLTGTESAAIRFTTGSIACFERDSIRTPWSLRFHMTSKVIERALRQRER